MTLEYPQSHCLNIKNIYNYINSFFDQRFPRNLFALRRKTTFGVCKSIENSVIINFSFLQSYSHLQDHNHSILSYFGHVIELNLKIGVY